MADQTDTEVVLTNIILKLRQRDDIDQELLDILQERLIHPTVVEHHQSELTAAILNLAKSRVTGNPIGPNEHNAETDG